MAKCLTFGGRHSPSNQVPPPTISIAIRASSLLVSLSVSATAPSASPGRLSFLSRLHQERQLPQSRKPLCLHKWNLRQCTTSNQKKTSKQVLPLQLIKIEWNKNHLAWKLGGCKHAPKTHWGLVGLFSEFARINIILQQNVKQQGLRQNQRNQGWRLI